MNDNILVSVCVVSYNSEKTILETLESVKNQTYKNIELVVSDDFSIDNTIKIAQRWIDENKDFFVRTAFLTVDHNTGVCANMNRSVKASRGEWIKGIAADDILLPNCITDLMRFVANNRDANFVASLQRVYKETFEEKNYINTTGYITQTFLCKSAEDQLKEVAFSHNISSPSMICSRVLLESIGGYDTRYGFEDYPLYINMLEHGYRIFFLPIETVCYRIHESTVHMGGMLFNPKFLVLVKRFRRERCFPYCGWRQKLSLRIWWAYQEMLDKLHLNKSTRLNLFFFKWVHSLTFFIARENFFR